MIVKKLKEFQQELVRGYKKELKEDLELDLPLKEYLAEQKKYSLEHERTDFNALQAAMRSAKVIGLGDYHEFSSSLSLLRELLKVVGQEETKTALGLEALIAGEVLREKHTKLEMKGRLAPLFRRESLEYQKLMTQACRQGIEVYGLNGRKRLREKDQQAAEIISRRIKEGEKQLIFIGEAHLCPDHLPREIQKKSKGVKQVLILQNLEPIYFTEDIYRESGLKGKPVYVRLKDSIERVERFCLLNTPPAEKLYALEYLIWEEKEKEEKVKEQIKKIREFLAEACDLRPGKPELEEDYVLCINQGVGKDYKEEIKESLGMVTKGLAALPTGIYKKIIYLAKPTLAHLAQIAGELVFEEAKREGMPREEIKKAGWNHFCSFLVNPYRHFKSWEELKEREEEEQEGVRLKTKVEEGIRLYFGQGQLAADSLIEERWIIYRVSQIQGRNFYDWLIEGRMDMERIKKELLG